MHHAGAMRRIERTGNRGGVPDRAIDRKRATLQDGGERLALQVLHDEVAGALLFADVVQRADVRVVETGDDARFTLEAFPRVRCLSERRREDLDSDGAIQPRVTRLIHLAHAACTERRDDLVRAEKRPARERHELSWIIRAVLFRSAGSVPSIRRFRR